MDGWCGAMRATGGGNQSHEEANPGENAEKHLIFSGRKIMASNAKNSGALRLHAQKMVFEALITSDRQFLELKRIVERTRAVLLA